MVAAKSVLQKIHADDRFPFLCIGLLYLFMFSFAPSYGDDALLQTQYANLNWSGYWDLAVQDWTQWSSRILVNFVIHVVLGKNKIAFTILNAFVCLALCISFSKLFISNDKRSCNWLIAAFMLLFPIKYFGTAGWRVTTMTYFWPIAMGFVSLIPIKKIIDEERFSIVESVLYSLALIYSANEELMLVILLSVYGVFGVYFIRHRKWNRYYTLQMIWLILSIIVLVICPGNHARSDTESALRFPNYGMLSLLDKIDIGFCATMQQILFGNELFFIVVCAVLFIIVLKKYTDWLYRFIAFLPLLFTVAIGPLKSFTVNLFTGADYFSWAIDETGLFSLEGAGMPAVIKFMTYCVIALCFMISIVLAFERSYQTLLSMTLLIAGTASRVAMGLSPTIYASGFRTATPMYMGLLAIGIMGVTYIKNTRLLSEREETALVLLLFGFTVFQTINSGISIYYNFLARKPLVLTMGMNCITK